MEIISRKLLFCLIFVDPVGEMSIVVKVSVILSVSVIFFPLFVASNAGVLECNMVSQDSAVVARGVFPEPLPALPMTDDVCSGQLTGQLTMWSPCVHTSGCTLI